MTQKSILYMAQIRISANERASSHTGSEREMCCFVETKGTGAPHIHIEFGDE